MKYVRIDSDGDRFKIVTRFLGDPVGRLAFEAAGLEGDGTGMAREVAEEQARKLDRWIEVQAGPSKRSRRG